MQRAKSHRRYDSYIQKMIVAEARRNKWRTMPLYDEDDLIEEGLVIFYLCLNKYPDRDQIHFRNTVKFWLHNHITDLANERTREEGAKTVIAGELATGSFQKSAAIDMDTESRKEIGERVPGSLWGASPEFYAQIGTAPEPLKRVLTYLLNDPKSGFSKTTSLGRETEKQALCRLAGVEDFATLHAMAKATF